MSVSKLQSSQVEIIIPPWALPKEEIPLHIKLSKNYDFSKIVVEIPDCFVFVDQINILRSEQSGNKIAVYEIGRAKKSEKDYFGIVIASKEPFEQLAVKTRIQVTLVNRDDTEENFTVFARIFRPLLEIDQIPDEIPIGDYDTILPIHLKFTGFGDVKVNIQCSIGGQIVSEGDSVLDEVIRRMVNEGLLHENTFENKLGIAIDKSYIQKIVSDCREKFKNSESMKQMMDDTNMSKDMVDALLSFNQDEQEKFMNILYRTVEGHLIKIITDILDRNISNNLHVDAGTKIRTDIKVPITNVTLKIFYSDAIGNEYPYLEKIVRLHDKRSDTSKIHVEIPVEIEKVDDSKAYKNVEEMLVGPII